MKTSTHRYSFVFVASIFLLDGCGTLPSSYKVESQFKAQHPECIVEKVSYKIEGQRLLGDGPGAIIRDNAIFEITYHVPGESTNHIAFRRFHTYAEGWVEQKP